MRESNTEITFTCLLLNTQAHLHAQKPMSDILDQNINTRLQTPKTRVMKVGWKVSVNTLIPPLNKVAF